MTGITVTPTAATMTVQDLGRPGFVGQGLARGGAMDRLAVLEAVALLGAAWPQIEMAGVGGRFLADGPATFALTGAPMKARLNGSDLAWPGTHRMRAGDVLEIGGASRGVYGYLTFAGGITGEDWLGSRAAHLGIGIGAPLTSGRIELGPDPTPDRPEMTLPAENRFGGGVLRAMPGPQTGEFTQDVRQKFFETKFRRAAQANRQGVKLDGGDAPFASATTTLASDFIQHGDIQMTGEGLPFILMAECQTIGGYPRIATVIDADLPRAAQAAEGDVVTFSQVSVADADAIWESDAAILKRLKGKVTRRVRNPREMTDLGAYRLIDGVTRGDDA